MKFYPALFAVSLLALTVPSFAATVPSGGMLKFDVLRNGDTVGSHTLTFSDDGQSVDIQTDIAVKVLFITAYRFEFIGHEEWRDGQVVALRSKSNDDGVKHTLSAGASDAGLAVNVDGAVTQADAAIVPASLWREETVSQQVLLNTLDGRKMNISVTDKGQESVEAGGTTIQARHFVLGGDLERELWYDANGMLVHVRFAAVDGSTIDYQLQ